MRKRAKKTHRIRSNTAPKKVVPMKNHVRFVFITLLGDVITNKEGRIKVMQDGGVSCLVPTEEGWKSRKGEIKSIKIVRERVYDKKLLGKGRRKLS